MSLELRKVLMKGGFMKPNVFIATPIAGFYDPKEYEQFRKAVKALIRKIVKKATVLSEITGIQDITAYDPPAISAEKDFHNIFNATHFILIYPSKVPTGALVELGYALALKKQILILTKSQDLLPHMIKELDKVYTNVIIFYFEDNFRSVESAVNNFL
jgi:nucleoside 2-deoxyribosyltransferase